MHMSLTIFLHGLLPSFINFSIIYFNLYAVVGGVFMVEHLNIYKILIEKVAKYLLLPGIELDINLNIRVSPL